MNGHRCFASAGSSAVVDLVDVHTHVLSHNTCAVTWRHTSNTHSLQGRYKHMHANNKHTCTHSLCVFVDWHWQLHCWQPEQFHLHEAEGRHTFRHAPKCDSAVTELQGAAGPDAPEGYEAPLNFTFFVKSHFFWWTFLKATHGWCHFDGRAFENDPQPESHATVFHSLRVTNIFWVSLSDSGIWEGWWTLT